MAETEKFLRNKIHAAGLIFPTARFAFLGNAGRHHHYRHFLEMQVITNIPSAGIVVSCALRQGDFDMPHQGAGFTKAESHRGAAEHDTYLNYETALLECASGSQSAVGKIYSREKDQLRAVADRIVHDRSP